MPTSNLALWPVILRLVYEVSPRSVLDVGPGHGKAAVLIREYVPCVERLDAVEAWEPYVHDFGLERLYDHVLIGDVLSLADHELAAYDLVLMVDVLEHLDREDGLALLARIPGRIVICTPASFFQNPEAETIWTERHRSLWSRPDFDPRIEVDASALGGIVVRLAPLPCEEG